MAPTPPPPDLDSLAAELVQAPPRLAATRLVAVDGPAGSGKTSLADALAARMGSAVVVHMDDVYRGWETVFAEVHERLRRQLFEPLAAGRTARYQRYDWSAGRFNQWVEVPPPEVLLLEGVGSGAAYLDPVLSLLIWVEVDRTERIRRGLARDGAAVLHKWLAWMDHEQDEHGRQRTRERAGLRLRGDGPAGRLTIVPEP